MHRIPLSLLLLLLLLACHVTTSLSNDAAVSRSPCDHSFDCGPLKNLSYPFSSAVSHPIHCGPPEFRLACTPSTAELSVDDIPYRVLRVDSLNRAMSLARSDLWSRTCPSEFRNTTVTNSPPFSAGTGNVDLTMFYSCNASALTGRPENQFRCGEYGNGSDEAYFLVGPVPFDPILRIFRCGESVRVPIRRSVEASLTRNRSMLGEALMLGFNVSYSIPFSVQCSRCLHFGGLCGYDSDSNGPICICGNRVCSVPDGNSAMGRTSTKIGLSIAGACILGMFIGGLSYYFIQRKKRRQADLAKSANLSTPPSSKSKNVSSTSFSRTTRSISSYNTSKSDIEKGSTYFGAQIFSYAELEEATNNFDASRELGEGGFGTVYYGELRDGREVAVKRLFENNFKRVEQFMNEIEILSHLEHPNLVKLYGCTTRRSRELLLVYEYVPNRTVADHLHAGNQQPPSHLPWPVRLNIAIETADALAHLHRKEIVHRDVKSNNILLGSDFRVKVADFGLSKLFPTNATHVSTAPQGTPGYVDPEYYQCYQLTAKSDVYSFGVVMAELVSSLPAVDTSRHRHDINLAAMAVSKVQSRTVAELVDPVLWRDEAVRGMAAAVAELAFRCLQQERDMRPSMEEVAAALRAIRGRKDEEEPEVVDVLTVSDDVGLLRYLPPPLSPDSGEGDRWAGGNTAAAAAYNSY